jgi:hypothetical protein
MPTWGELLKELQDLHVAVPPATQTPGQPSAFDLLRRKYLAALAQQTGRAVIVYETAYLEARSLDPTSVAVHLGDLQGFMEAVSNVHERELDLFLHSPGGSAEAAESIVEYLRTRFDHIRVIVPLAAMSAATMIALAADEIVMGTHSQLGPIDPQFTVSTPEGPRSSPGQAILDQFELAKQECQDPKNLPAWLPILRYYGPGLIAQVGHQAQLARSYVGDWLQRFMFRADPAGPDKAKKAADWFSDFKTFKSHGRRVSRDDVRALGLHVVDLEADDGFQDAALSVHHAVQHTLAATAVAKIIENHHGRAWLKISQTQQIQLVPAPQPGAGTPGAAPRGVRPPVGPNLGGSKRGRRHS